MNLRCRKKNLLLRALVVIAAVGVCMTTPTKTVTAAKGGGKKGGGGSTGGGGTAAVVRVEEDWTIQIRDGFKAESTPQLICVISPFGHIDGLHFLMEFNHSTLPDYIPGGLQLQAWDGDLEVASGPNPIPKIMEFANETVTFTLRMEVGSGAIKVDVINGQSQSWGSFGGIGTAQVVASTSLANLSNYSPTVSVANSGVNVAGHRVDSMGITAVRTYDASGNLLNTDSTPREVHAYRTEVKYQSYEEAAQDVLDGDVTTLDDLLNGF